MYSVYMSLQATAKKVRVGNDLIQLETQVVNSISTIQGALANIQNIAEKYADDSDFTSDELSEINDKVPELMTKLQNALDEASAS